MADRDDAFMLLEHYADCGLINRPVIIDSIADPSSDDCCPKCGHVLQIGDFPFCGPDGHSRRAAAVHQDSVEGGFWAENGFKEPRFFESRKAHRDALAAEGKEIRAKWAGPNDKHLSRMDIPCAATLESARILLSRKKSTPFASEPDPTIEFPITVTDIYFERPK